MRQARSISSWSIATWLVAFPALSLAHHGIGGQFDREASREITGEITEILWRNPHVLFTVAVTDESGQMATWEVESLSLSMMRRVGISRELLVVGERVRLLGLPSTRDRNELYVTNLLRPDGQEIVFNMSVEPRWSDRVVGKSGPGAVLVGDTSAPDHGIFRVWSNTRVTPGLYAALSLDSNPLNTNSSAGAEPATARDCIPKAMPGAMGQPYPMEFVRDGDKILLRLEEYDAVRTIHMAPDEEATRPPSLLGYSRGRWEGDTLVVTTTRIANPLFARGIKLSGGVNLEERFTPTPDGDRLDYKLTVTDPEVLDEPIELEKFWLYVPNVTIEPYRCVEG